MIRRNDQSTWGKEPFTIGLWVGKDVTPNKTKIAEKYLKQLKDDQIKTVPSPCQIKNCPWCGSEVREQDTEVDTIHSRTRIFCGDKKSECEFTKRNSREIGIPMMVVDEEMYRKPPSNSS